MRHDRCSLLVMNRSRARRRHVAWRRACRARSRHRRRSVPPSQSRVDGPGAQTRCERITDELERLEQESDILAEDYVDGRRREEPARRRGRRRRGGRRRQGGRGRRAPRRAVRGRRAGVHRRRARTRSGPMFSDSSRTPRTLQRDQLSRVALSTGTATTDELDQAVSELEAQRSSLEDMRAAAERADPAGRRGQGRQRGAQGRVRDGPRRGRGEARPARSEEEEERRARESYERMQREAEEAAAARRRRAGRRAAAAQQQAAERRPATATTRRVELGDARDGGGGDGGGGDGGGGGGGESVVAAGPGSRRRRRPIARAEAGAGSRAAGARAQLPAGVVAGRHRRQRAMSQIGVPVPLRLGRARRGVRLLRPDVVGVGPGRGLPAAPVAASSTPRVPHVPSSAAQPGDLIFFYSPISHVSIYLGGGQQVHAPNSGSTREGRHASTGATSSASAGPADRPTFVRPGPARLRCRG